MNETNPLVFYANRNCPYAQRSWMTLLELSVDFEYQEIELGKDNKTDWFCALNPNGTVPVIKHGDTVVYESLVVNEYLCEVFGGNGLTLMPSQPAARARARMLMTHCDSKFVKLSYSYLSHKRTEDVAKDDQLRAQLEEELNVLDAAIGASSGPYFMGETVSLVDIAFMPFFERMSVALATWKDFEIANPARSPLTPPEGRSHLKTWLEAMSNRDSYRQTRMSPERIIELYSRFLNLDYFKRVGVAQ